MGDIAAALAYIQNFENNGGSNVAWHLDRYWTLQRIRRLVQHPSEINQRGLNACGPAVFFRIWFARDPLAAATFACNMLRDGSASIGTLIVASGWRLLAQDYALLKSATESAHAGATPENAEWMLLSSLRDSENIFFDYLGEPYTTMDMAAGVTLPSTLASWLNATGLYAGVANETSVVYPAGQQRLLSLIPTSDVDIVLLVSSSFNAGLYPSIPPGVQPPPGGIHIPDHYVLVTAPFAKSTESLWLQFEVWSWGRVVTGWAGYAQFFTKYFGPLIAKRP
ncbi:hypothetical protein [Mesorhizobium sp.]|uniref:hypothetical protein n=1 Tax=Mesorhizobium sp. TaxID=1871066 RepID=UPI000FE95501|nr:hypothetical protein [Mesorhizobium sp.]RWP30701.1 MAG: hypothetical protein EOR03_24275 [Mesorhizobium sp.]